MNTRIVKIENPADCADEIKAAGDILRAGGLAAIPTETVYGLAANALDGKAVKKIFEAKGRPQDNPLIVHVSAIEQVPPLVEKVDERLYALAERFWPGPLTVIMKKSDLIPDEVCAGLDTVAIRMPSNPIAAAIIGSAGVPLAAPSANTSGKPSPTKAKHVIEDMNSRIDMIVDGGSCEIGVESTVITLATEPPRLLRPGKVTPEELESVLGKIELDKAVFSKLQSGEKAHSPGMKYKHYAPKANVFLLKGSLENAADYVNKRCDDTCCVLCFAGEKEKFNCRAVEYGVCGDGESQANRIFDELRKLDESDCKTAYVRSPGEEGVQLAVYNRLLRACAFRIIDVDSKMPVIGLTGPTGAGKSTVCEYLAEKGFYIIDGDLLARQAVENNDVLYALTQRFGTDILDENGKLLRKVLAQKAFADRESTDALNAILHPAITSLAYIELNNARCANAPAAVIDAAALFESPLTAVCDITAAVIAGKETRIARVIERDGITCEQALTRMNAQHPDDYYTSRCNMVINNSTGDDYIAGCDKLINLVGGNKNV